MTSAFSDGRLRKPGRKLRRRCVLSKLRIKRTPGQEGKRASREGRPAATRWFALSAKGSLFRPFWFFPLPPFQPPPNFAHNPITRLVAIVTSWVGPLSSCPWPIAPTNGLFGTLCARLSRSAGFPPLCRDDRRFSESHRYAVFTAQRSCASHATLSWHGGKTAPAKRRSRLRVLSSSFWYTRRMWTRGSFQPPPWFTEFRHLSRLLGAAYQLMAGRCNGARTWMT